MPFPSLTEATSMVSLPLLSPTSVTILSYLCYHTHHSEETLFRWQLLQV